MYKVTLPVNEESIQKPTMTIKEWEQEDAAISKTMLDQQFTSSVATDIPVNYPLKSIGSCPYSKPPSMDLPLVDMPMCVSVKSHDMRIASCNLS